jgi:hypothetical protein
VAPARPPVTWPMVAYAFVQGLPYTMMIAAGGVVAVVFVVRNPASSFEPLMAVIGPAIVSALGRSRPVEALGPGAVGFVAASAFALRKLFGGHA